MLRLSEGDLQEVDVFDDPKPAGDVNFESRGLAEADATHEV